MESISVDPANTYFSADKILYNYSKTKLVYCPRRYRLDSNLLLVISIPSTVTELEAYAFYNLSARKKDGNSTDVQIMLTSSIMSIGTYCFTNAGISRFYSDTNGVVPGFVGLYNSKTAKNGTRAEGKDSNGNNVGYVLTNGSWVLQ